MSDAAISERDHAALMDRVYRYQRHFYDATRRYYLLGRDHLIAELAPPDGGRVLEIGCGTARNLIAAARAYPGARFYGIDISAQMLASGRRAVARAGLGDRIILAQADATDFDPAAAFGVDGFERVFCSYTLSMIPDWRSAQRAALAAVKPGGRLHIVDFGQCERLPGALRQALVIWLAWFHVTPRRRLHEALDELARRTRGRLSARALYRGYAWYVTFERA